MALDLWKIEYNDGRPGGIWYEAPDSRYRIGDILILEEDPSKWIMFYPFDGPFWQGEGHRPGQDYRSATDAEVKDYIARGKHLRCGGHSTEMEALRTELETLRAQLADVKRLQEENESLTKERDELKARLSEIEGSATYYVTQDLAGDLYSPASDPDQAMLNGLAEFCGEGFTRIRVAILGYEQHETVIK